MKNGCAACGKRHGGRMPANWMPIDVRNKDTGELEDCLAVCGWDCMTNWMSKETKPMIDPTKPELDALLVAGEAGGQYLESIGKFDLSVLSTDEWTTFLSCVVSTYQDEKIPF